MTSARELPVLAHRESLPLWLHRHALQPQRPLDSCCRIPLQISLVMMTASNSLLTILSRPAYARASFDQVHFCSFSVSLSLATDTAQGSIRAWICSEFLHLHNCAIYQAL